MSPGRLEAEVGVHEWRLSRHAEMKAELAAVALGVGRLP